MCREFFFLKTCVVSVFYLGNIAIVALQQLLAYLSHNNLLFNLNLNLNLLSHRTTETLLFKTLNDIFFTLDKGHVSLFTLLYLSSTFETIDHNTFLYRPRCLYGISSTCPPCFSSYLSNRRLLELPLLITFLRPKNFIMLFCRVVLGPILFILHVQPLTNLIKLHSLYLKWFADGIHIVTSILPQHIHSVIFSVATCISDIKN